MLYILHSCGLVPKMYQYQGCKIPHASILIHGKMVETFLDIHRLGSRILELTFL